MKLVFWLIVALAITIAWQTSVLSEEKGEDAPNGNTTQIQPEDRGAGRQVFAPCDCD